MDHLTPDELERERKIAALVKSAVDHCRKDETYLRAVLEFYFKQYNDDTLEWLYNGKV